MNRVERPAVYGSYDYHSDYYSINTGAHRKGGIELSTPTLTNHLGLWFPLTERSSQAQRTVERFGRAVDKYIGAIFGGLRRQAGFESNFEFDVGSDLVLGLFGGAYRVATDILEPFDVEPIAEHFALKDALDSDNRILFAKTDWHGLRVIVRCEFHSEFFTITRFATVTDMSNLPAPVAALRDHLSVLAQLRCDGDGSPSPGDNDIGTCHNFLYQKIWDLIDRDLFRAPSLFLGTTVPDRSRIFADFRGLVVAGNEAATCVTTGNFSKGPDRGQVFDETWTRTKLMPSLWPFLTAKDGLDLKRREFTASFMLGHRAVYITALGPQPPAATGAQCTPLNYFLVARPTNDWQLGALVDRLHYMGAVRLAALMELPALRKAGANLRDMEHEAEEARKAIEADDTTTARDFHRRIILRIAHTDAQQKPIFWAGLQFRVERSRYYVQRFTDFVPFLDIDQIQGFQRYDHFVKGRLGGVYDYIDRLGIRQERAITSATGIFQSIFLLEQAETNHRIAEANQQSAEANRQSAEANRQSADANEKSTTIARRGMQISKTIEKLQTKAEVALLLVIVPHYLIEIVKNYKEKFHMNEWSTLKAFIIIDTIGAFGAIVSIVAYGLEHQKEWDFQARLRALTSIMLFLLAIIAIAIAIVAVF